MAVWKKREGNDTGAVDGQAREAQEPPAQTDGGGSMHQDQGAQVVDVPVVDIPVDDVPVDDVPVVDVPVDDAVDESADAPAEAPPIEGREVAAPAERPYWPMPWAPMTDRRDT